MFVVFALIFRTIFQADSGSISNQLVQALGFGSQGWLQNSKQALPLLAIPGTHDIPYTFPQRFTSPWREFEQCIELIMHRSSTCCATWGNSSLTHIPLWPCC